LWAIAKKETGNLEESKRDSDRTGDGGLSWGRYQLKDIYVRDVNRIYKTNYTHDDALNKQKAEEMVVKYTTFYSQQYEKKVGRKITMRERIALHNGGPNGPDMRSTDAYVNDVVEYLTEKMKTDAGIK
jgi:hypothetical protein